MYNHTCAFTHTHTRFSPHCLTATSCCSQRLLIVRVETKAHMKLSLNMQAHTLARRKGLQTSILPTPPAGATAFWVLSPTVLNYWALGCVAPRWGCTGQVQAKGLSWLQDTGREPNTWALPGCPTPSSTAHLWSEGEWSSIKHDFCLSCQLKFLSPGHLLCLEYWI